MEWHEHVADMLFMGTVVTFVLGVIYAFVYTNYRRNIRRYMALDLKVPGCYYYETDSEDSEDEVFVTQDEGLPSAILKQMEEAEEEDKDRKVSVLERMRDM